MGRHWTTKEVKECERLRFSGMTIPAIADAMNRTYCSIKRRLDLLRVNKVSSLSKYKDFLAQPHTLDEAVDFFGITKGAVCNIKRKLSQAGFPVFQPKRSNTCTSPSTRSSSMKSP